MFQLEEDKKMDATAEVFKIENVKLEIVGGGSAGRRYEKRLIN